MQDVFLSVEAHITLYTLLCLGGSDIVSTPQIVAGVIQIILALAVTVIVMMQEGNERGLGAISGGADTFFSKNSAATPQARLRKNTIWLGIAFILATIVLYILVSVA